MFTGPEEVLDRVFKPILEEFEQFAIEIERLIDTDEAIVMQGHYLATGALVSAFPGPVTTTPSCSCRYLCVFLGVEK